MPRRGASELLQRPDPYVLARAVRAIGQGIGATGTWAAHPPSPPPTPGVADRSTRCSTPVVAAKAGSCPTFAVQICGQWEAMLSSIGLRVREVSLQACGAGEKTAALDDRSQVGQKRRAPLQSRHGGLSSAQPCHRRIPPLA